MTRSTNYVSMRLKCDRDDKDLPTAGRWHRFVGNAGTAMATSCVPDYRCAAISPGWLANGHPSVEQGQAIRRVCFSRHHKCCNRKMNILVRNCGEFYVYKLTNTPLCMLRYCVESKGNVSLISIVMRAIALGYPPTAWTSNQMHNCA